MRRFFPLINMVWLVLALSGCQQVESRLLADAKTLLDAFKPDTSQETPLAQDAPVATTLSTPPTIVTKQTTDPVQPLELGKDCPHCPELVGLPAGLTLLGDKKIGPEPVWMAIGERLTLGKTDEYQGFVFSLRLVSQTHL